MNKTNLTDEEKYQYGLRELPPVKLVRIINEYRDELKSCCNIFKDFAQNNLAQDPMHKVVCARKLARVESMVKDIDVVLRGGEQCNNN